MAVVASKTRANRLARLCMNKLGLTVSTYNVRDVVRAQRCSNSIVSGFQLRL